MKKQLFLLIASLFVAISSYSQVSEPLVINATPPVLETDTVIDGDHIFLTRYFYFGKDTLVVETGYKYTNPKDFSFNYEELEEGVVVALNSEVLDTDNDSHEPLVHSYNGEIYGEVISANGMDYLIVLGKEFYCDGPECSSIYALVVNTKTGVCLDINTGFCKEKDLLKQINKRSAANDNVQVPVINSCDDSYSDAKWINVDKAL